METNSAPHSNCRPRHPAASHSALAGIVASALPLMGRRRAVKCARRFGTYHRERARSILAHIRGATKKTSAADCFATDICPGIFESALRVADATERWPHGQSRDGNAGSMVIPRWPGGRPERCCGCPLVVRRCSSLPFFEFVAALVQAQLDSLLEYEEELADTALTHHPSVVNIFFLPVWCNASKY